jgi:hypothetical protein
MDKTNQTRDIEDNYRGRDGHAKYDKPKSFIQAVSEIQHFYVMEKDSEEPIDENFFALSQVLDFIKVGFKSGFIESFLFITLFPFLQTIYPSFAYYFLNKNFSEIELLIFKYISYVPLIIITLYLVHLAKFNTLIITKKATLSLVSGRSIAFLLKGIIVYFLFTFLSTYVLEHEELIYNIIDSVKGVIDILLPAEYTYRTDDLYVYFYKYIQPAMNYTAFEVLISMFIFSLIPFLIILSRGWVNDYKKIKSQIQYEEY